MPDYKISGLSAASAANATDELETNQSGTSRKLTLAQVLAYIQGAISVAWGSVTGKPTTLGGYGITDAAPLASPTFTGTPAAPTAAVGTNTTQLATAAFVLANGDKLGLTPVAVKTANYTAAAGEFVPCDTSAGAFTVTLPTAPADKTVVAIKLVTAGNTLNLALGGSDVFNKAGGSASGTLALVNQSLLCQYQASTGIWYVVVTDVPLSGLDARFQSAVTHSRPKGGGTPAGTIPGYDNGVIATTTMALTADTTYYVPIRIEFPTTLDQLPFTVNATGTATLVRLAIFASTGDMQPGARIVDAGTVAVGTTGGKAASISQPLQPGNYLLAINANGTVTLTAARGGIGFSATFGTYQALSVAESGIVSGGFPSTGTAWSSPTTGTTGFFWPVTVRIP